MTVTAPPKGSEFIGALIAELSSENLVFSTSLNATMKIRQALGNPNVSNEHIARIISVEPVLSSQLLQVCNSVMYRRGTEKITELRVATLRLGFGTVRNVAISVGMKQLMEHKASGKVSPRMEGLWARSLRVAALSFVIAKNLTRLNPDNAMVARLLADVGKFYILNRARHFKDGFDSEPALWDFVDKWHARFGDAILKKWDIAPDIRIAVNRYESGELPESALPDLTDVILAADFLDAHFIAKSISALDWESLPPALQRLDLDLEKSEILINDTKEELDLILKAIA